jgi:hypothetical protein
MNPVPDAEADEILTVEFPAFVSVTFWVAPTPIVVFPKLIEVGLAES